MVAVTTLPTFMPASGTVTDVMAGAALSSVKLGLLVPVGVVAVNALGAVAVSAMS